jgi:glycosyltransferase involved in cell wall biosynthesis
VSGVSRIGYDARLAIEPCRGMGRYLRALIRGRERDLLGFCASGENSSTLNVVQGGARFYPLWEQFSLPHHIRARGVDTFIAPFNTAPLRLPSQTRLILIIHDLIFFDPLPWSRSLYQNMGRIYRRFIVPRAAARADLIITVSEYSKSQILQRFRLPADRVVVIPCSLPASWFDFKPKTPAEKSYVLMVSGEAPSKNLKAGIAGFAHIAPRRKDLHLKVVGVKPTYHNEFVEFAREHGIGNRIHFAGFLSEEELKDIYRRAEAFVLPSLAEGFGIPLLEAMASGVPIASSSATSLPEVAGDAALYFDPSLEEEIGLRLIQILESPETKQRLIEAGRRQVLKFHEDRVGEMIQALWARLDLLAPGTRMNQ